MDYLSMLDSIMLSDNVVDNFYGKYNSDTDFRNWVDITIPDISKCEAQAQNNPWHKYNVLGHILHSVFYINQLSKDLDYDTRRMLSYVMLMHDIGKPDTHITRLKDGHLIDSFFNHNVRSVEIAQKVLPNLNFGDADIKVMLKLIYKHDIFMFIKTYSSSNPYWKKLDEKVITEEITDLDSVGNGYQLLQLLVMVGRSDNLAQNEKMTRESLNMLDVFDKMLIDMKAKYIKKD